ncbi:hypothetical protein Caci_0981 [Catenulispora acidiphila DSM 44928]|uniref:Uncharacterized protein n=1 Tax=Catenulispora acidiphila (strain DSM 44928 / JCM 14897 / NBRC 102108 / NRRL B-24433 / ID139908) TaxID=479433 RepID=C7Q452_CATAD|nr:hypothetical protein [Catenulispora acidiphila]ACU69912.1 hypothetical protein Caci_0981 [Catenulispora acidiphila DSM 44928]
MTEHESDDHLRVLFRGADLDDVPVTRDLIGPAVAWGDGRRRRDRWRAVGATGAVAAVAVAGIVALRPAGADGVAPSSPVSPVSQSIQRELSTLRPFLPAGYTLTCQNTEGVFCAIFVLTSPAGGTSLVFWHTGMNIPLEDGPPSLADTVHVHEQGTQTFANGSMAILAYDLEARGMGSATAEELTDPTEIVGNQVTYTFTPDGSPRTYGIEMAQMVKDMPWKSGTSKSPDDRARFGYNPGGPVLSTEQFDRMASAPGFLSALAQVVDWGAP